MRDRRADRLDQASEVRVPKRVHQRRALAARTGAAGATSGCEIRRATRWRSSEIFSRGNFVTIGVPSFEAMTAFGPLLTTVAEIGRPSDEAMSCEPDAVVRAVDDDPDDVAEAQLARQLEELRAVAERADLGGDDEEDLVRDGQHRHGAVVVAGVVVDDHVGVVVRAPSAAAASSRSTVTRSDSAGSVPQVRTRTPLSAWIADDLLEGGIGPLLGRAVGQVGQAHLVRHVEDGGHVPDADVGVEEEDLGPRLLAQRDGHVHGDRGLADAALRGEDADDVALAGDRRGAEALVAAHCPDSVGQVAAGADEERLEAIDERIGRQRLQGDLVAGAADAVGQVAAGADEEQGRGRLPVWRCA